MTCCGYAQSSVLDKSGSLVGLGGKSEPATWSRVPRQHALLRLRYPGPGSNAHNLTWASSTYFFNLDELFFFENAPCLTTSWKTFSEI